MLLICLYLIEVILSLTLQSGVKILDHVVAIRTNVQLISLLQYILTLLSVKTLKKNISNYLFKSSFAPTTHSCSGAYILNK